jgi:hypothetical protein
LIWKALFSALGFGSFLFILSGYGFPRLAADIMSLGWWSVPLALSFLPTVFCYALAWLLITPELSLSHLWALHRLTVISVAWNNLSPFVKILGEPVRLILLGQWLDPKAAARSMVLYNIVHVLGTLFSFFLGALALLLFFPVSEGIHKAFVSLLFIAPLLAFGLYFLPHLAKRFGGRTAKRNRIVLAGFWLRWGFSKIRMFSRRYPMRFWAAVGLEVVARFVEGATFYVAFLALHHPVSALVCGLLDVGRALMDNIFFFIPYQVGSREGGILMLAEHAVKIGSAAVFYRLVEILWMGIGYLLWINEERVRKSSI